MSEVRIPGHCSCGKLVIKVLHSDIPTMWRNGDRYAYPDRIDKDRWCIFRCDSCGQPIDETFIPEEDLQ